MSIRGIIFDFDGTLFDTMHIWNTAGSDYLATLGITAKSDLNRTISPMPMRDSAQFMKSEYALSLSVEEIMDGVNRMIADFYCNHALPKENVLSSLEYLREHNIKMCIATATDRVQIEAALKRCGMSSFFEAVYTCSEVGCGKERPDIYLEALASLGTEISETAVFEDAFHAAKTAKDAGFFLTGVYDPSEWRREEMQRISDLYIENFSEITRLPIN